MNQSILHVALVVRDYDEAIAFFCEKLHFTLVEDTYQPEQDKRWVLVAPPGSKRHDPAPCPSIDARTSGFHRPADRRPRVPLPAD